MFDEFFGEKAKASAAVDAYLERMERVFKLKKIAKEVNETTIEKDTNIMLKELINLTTIQARDTIKKYQEEKENVSPKK